ncbi:hypothetical protein XHV734_4924 [Xanthomonas hortorum pv. vitians]|nr:hypothetical protein XHV734_4924 [Xanthomonas hortorum pv. vitians]
MLQAHAVLCLPSPSPSPSDQARVFVEPAMACAQHFLLEKSGTASQAASSRYRYTHCTSHSESDLP